MLLRLVGEVGCLIFAWMLLVWMLLLLLSQLVLLKVHLPVWVSFVGQSYWVEIAWPGCVSFARIVCARPFLHCSTLCTKVCRADSSHDPVLHRFGSAKMFPFPALHIPPLCMVILVVIRT